MQPIQLTEEHKSKLLEMCKRLFPEYNDTSEGGTGSICFHHNDLYSGMLFGFKSNGEDGDSYDNASLIIHWFEFCMTHLVNRIYYPDDKVKRDTRAKVEYFFFQTFIDSVEGSTAGYQHPVDYLYQEFKKMK